MKLAVILPAGGSSSRYLAGGAARHKLDEDLGGKPVLQRTVELFTKLDEEDVSVVAIVVAGPHDERAHAEFCERHADRLGLLGAKIVRGGPSQRWESVAAALPAALAANPTHIAVHDAARPCTPVEVLSRVLRAAMRHRAVIPALDVPDTIKRVESVADEAVAADPFADLLGAAPPSAPARRVTQTVPRDGLVLVQTPQVFEAGVLARAYARAAEIVGKGETITDDAGLVAAFGEVVRVVEGDARNIKLTLPADTELARRILNVQGPGERSALRRF